MGKTTAIEWTDHTFSPWAGCHKVSPACKNCYAEKGPLASFKGIAWGPDTPRRPMADSTWANPIRWNRAAEKAGVQRRVFCGSVCDVFEARGDLDERRARLWRLIEATPNLIWLLLTKRPEEVLRRVPVWWLEAEAEGAVPAPAPTACRWPSNCWIGTTVEDQQRADERIPHLLRIPAPVRFLSMEPLLGPVDLASGYLADVSRFTWSRQSRDPYDRGIQWVIAGGESGPRARPSHPDWFRSIRDQCEAVGVPFFFKQANLGNGLEKMPALDGKVWAEVPR